MGQGFRYRGGRDIGDQGLRERYWGLGAQRQREIGRQGFREREGYTNLRLQFQREMDRQIHGWGFRERGMDKFGVMVLEREGQRYRGEFRERERFEGMGLEREIGA